MLTPTPRRWTETTGPALLLGRDQEVAELCDALATAANGSPQTVLVGGDAGIGKTTLVNHAEQQAADLGFTVVVGHCLDLEADISFAPVVEAVRALVSGADDLVNRPSARRMLSLLDPETPRSQEPFRVLDDLRQTVLEAAVAGPLMIVLEDMHWADRSTQDFAAALSRAARGRLLLVLTVRDEDLHRRHPARRTLAEISRVPGARRLDLPPLRMDGIAGIVAAHAGAGPDPRVVRTVFARSEGDPLYAEELVAADLHAIPEHLSDLFLARVDVLGDGPRELLRVASVDGTRVDTETLGELARLDRSSLDAWLRELLDANLLRGAGDSLAFRHGLLREAVYDDLLPDERTRLHADLAAILQGRVDADPDPGLSVLSRLAFHWHAAHELPRTLETSVRAGMVARRLGVAEEVTQLERALSLWDRVPDAEARAGRSRIEIVVRRAQAANSQGDGEGWHTYARRAVDMLEPDTDPLVASRAYSALGFSAFFTQDSIGAEEAIRRAVAFAGDAPTGELVWALAAQAHLHCRNDRFAGSLAAAERALDAAGSAADTDPEALMWALNGKAVALGYLGRLTESCATGEQLVKVARGAGMIGAALGFTVWLAAQMQEAGRVDRGRSIARAGYQEALDAGLVVDAAACGDLMAIALTWQGRLDPAEKLVGELEELGAPADGLWRCQAELSLARGDAQGAARVTPGSAVDDVADGTHPDEYDVLRNLRLADLLGDTARCHRLAAEYLALLEDGDSPLIAAAGARIGFHALSTSTPVEQAGRLRDQAVRLLELAREGLTDEWRGGYHGVQLALAEAYAARVSGEPAAAQFREATRLAEPFGAFFALEPRLDLAQELLGHGGRDEGRELLVECWTAAHEMGARGLERARPGSPPAPASRSRGRPRVRDR